MFGYKILKSSVVDFYENSVSKLEEANKLIENLTYVNSQLLCANDKLLEELNELRESVKRLNEESEIKKQKSRRRKITKKTNNE